MKSWHVLLIGMAAGVACVLIAKKLLGQDDSSGGVMGGIGGMGGDAAIPPPNPPWFNLGVKPMDYAYTGWNPPEAYAQESRKLAQLVARRRQRRGGMGEYAALPGASAYPMVLSPYPQYPTYPQTYAVDEPIDWQTPKIDARFSSEMDAF